MVDVMKKILLAVLLVFAAAVPAQANVFVWKDPKYKFTVSFPDTWMRQAINDDDLRLNILAPQGNDHAACRVYASHDGLFNDAPASAKANLEVSQFLFTDQALKMQLFGRPDVNMVQLDDKSEVAGLGRGSAVLAHAQYQKTYAGQIFPMRSIVLASQHYGDRIVMTCESLTSAYESWEPLFKGIIKSMDFPSAYSPNPNGLYRRFQDDGWVIFPKGHNEGATKY